MNLFELSAKIKLDASDYESKLSKAADNAEKAAGAIGKAMESFEGESAESIKDFGENIEDASEKIQDFSQNSEKISDAVQDFAQVIEDAGEKTEEFSEQSEKISEGLDDISGSSEKASEVFDKVSKSSEKFSKSMAGGFGNAIKNISKSVSSLPAVFGKLSTGVSKGVAVSKKALESLKGVFLSIVNSAKRMASSVAHSVAGMASKIGHAVGGIAKATATATAAAGAAFVALTVKALDSAGNLEQGFGGAEAVFGEYAGKMQTDAVSAFDKMGLSANGFMETANKMGALFKGSGFEIAEAADLTTKAMQRAADVASIMGIDVEFAMESVAGAAKGNFTMMDNLGVAMNDTAIGAYALSKGIEKATKEMTMQEKVGLAMQMFLEKTAYAAGNYAKENETLAGSLATTKAAFDNFLSGAGDADQLIASLEKTISVVSLKLKDLVPRLTEGVGKLVEKLIPEIPGAIEQLLPGIVSGLSSLASEVGKVLPDILKTVTQSASSLIFGATGIDLDPLFNTLRNSFEDIGKIISEFSKDADFSKVTDGINDFINGLSIGISRLTQAYSDGGFSGVMQEIISMFKDFSGINLAPMSEAIGTTFDNIFGAVSRFAESQDFSGVFGIINGFINGLADAIIRINEAGSEGGFSGIIGELLSMFEELTGIDLSPAAEAVSSISNSLAGVIEKITGDIDFEQVKQDIVDGINGAIEKVSEELPPIFERLSGAFQEDGISGVFDQIGTDLSGFLTDAITSMTDNMPDDFDVLREEIKTNAETALEGFSDAAKEFSEKVDEKMAPVNEATKGFFDKLGQTMFEGLEPDEQSALTETIEAAEKLGQIFADLYKTLNDITFLIYGFIDALVGPLVEGIKGLDEGLPEQWEGNMALINGIVDTGTGLIQGDFEEAAEGAKTAFDGMGTFFDGLAQSCVGAWDGIQQKFEEIGENIVKGLKKGLGWVGDKVSGWWETGKQSMHNLIFGAEDAADINSPSRVFRWIGEMLMQGLDLGIRDGEFGVIRRWDDIYKEMLPKKYDFSSSAIGKASSATINGIMQTAQQAAGGSFNINLVVDGETLAEVAFDPLRAVAKRKGAVAL